jgi:hypothetical protein
LIWASVGSCDGRGFGLAADAAYDLTGIVFEGTVLPEDGYGWAVCCRSQLLRFGKLAFFFAIVNSDSHPMTGPL